MKRKIKFIIVALMVLGFAGVAIYFGISLFNKNEVYTDYEVLVSVDRNDSQNAEYCKFGDGFLRYSRDGIAYYGSDMIPQWNNAYQLQTPIIDICGEYCAVASAGGSQLYVFNKEGAVMSVDTALAIITVSVSAKGYVAVILEDTDVEYIAMYDTAGEKVYNIKTFIKGKGTPTDISISDDGAKLAVAYTTIGDLGINTSVIFYNFGEVGKNESERLVGGFDQYEGMLIPHIQFVNEDTMVAFATEKVSIYKISQYPELITDIIPEMEIHSVFYSDKYIALIYAGYSQEYPYNILVYDLKGTNVFNHGIDKAYKSYEFADNNILMYDDNKALLVDFNGKTRFEYEFDIAVDALINIEGDDVYSYINSRKIQKIKLK